MSTVTAIATADTTSTRRRDELHALAHPGARGAEQPGVAGDLGQHEDRGEERERRRETIERVADLVDPDQSGDDHEHRRRSRHPQIGHPAPRHQRQDGGEHEQAPRGPHHGGPTQSVR